MDSRVGRMSAELFAPDGELLTGNIYSRIFAAAIARGDTSGFRLAGSTAASPTAYSALVN
jgi:hypothetical protein